MLSVRIEFTELILVGTRITYQATGDAGIYTDVTTVCTMYSAILRVSFCI